MEGRTPRGYSTVHGNRVADGEEALIVAAMAGDDLAYGELFRRHSRKVFRTVFRIVRNSEDAEDVVQDSFFRAFMRLASFKRTCAFSTWVTRIGINSALLLLRRHRNELHRQLITWDAEDNHPFDDLVEVSPSPEDLAVSTEMANALAGGISRLPTLLRDVISFRCYESASTKEVAMTMGLSEAAVKTRLCRARSKLRQTLRSQVEHGKARSHMRAVPQGR